MKRRRLMILGASKQRVMKRVKTILDLGMTRLSILRTIMFANYLMKLPQSPMVTIVTYHHIIPLLALAQDITIIIMKLRRSLLSLICPINSWQPSNHATLTLNRQEVAYLSITQKMFASAWSIRGSPSKYEYLSLVNNQRREL